MYDELCMDCMVIIFFDCEFMVIFEILKFIVYGFEGVIV